MSLQMNLIFGGLVGQMAVLLLLLLPLPHVVRVKILDIANLLKKQIHFKVGVVFSTSLLGLSFFDCINRLKRFDNITAPYFTTFNQQAAGSLSYDQLATKFYTQRNLYLTGAVLYLELSIYTIVGVLTKLVNKETEYRALKEIQKGEFANEKEEVEKYKELIKQKSIDVELLTKQVENLQQAYDKLSDAPARTKSD